MARLVQTFQKVGKGILTVLTMLAIYKTGSTTLQAWQWGYCQNEHETCYQDSMCGPDGSPYAQCHCLVSTCTTTPPWC